MMSAGSHIADTIRTLLIGGTVAFLGYLGYVLIQAKINNPPPQLVTMNDENLEDLRAQIKSLERKLSERARDTCQLQTRLDEVGDSLRHVVYANVPTGTLIEYGSVTFEKGRKYHRRKVKFQNRYAVPPLVIVSEAGTAGDWVTAKSQRITKKGAEIAVLGKQNYPCRIGYIVIGEAVKK